MFLNIPDNVTMLDTQFFMMKYGAFIVAGIIGSIATVGNNVEYTAKTFIKHLVMAIVLSVVFGILLMNFWDLYLEVAWAMVTLLSFFMKKVVVELTELLEAASDLIKGFVMNKFGKNKSKDEETKPKNDDALNEA